MVSCRFSLQLIHWKRRFETMVKSETWYDHCFGPLWCIWYGLACWQGEGIIIGMMCPPRNWLYGLTHPTVRIGSRMFKATLQEKPRCGSRIIPWLPVHVPFNQPIERIETCKNYIVFLDSDLVGGLDLFFYTYIGNNNPKWLIFFRGVGIPPTSDDLVVLVNSGIQQKYVSETREPHQAGRFARAPRAQAWNSEILLGTSTNRVVI